MPTNQWLCSEHDTRHHHFRRYHKRQFRALWSGADVLLISHCKALLFPPAAIVRVATRWLPQRVASHGLGLPPAPLNSLLNHMLAGEAALLSRLPLPCGLSLVAVVRKRTQK